MSMTPLRPSPAARATPVLGAIVGALFFLWLAGTRGIDPTEVGWAMKYDWATHYFGWKYFRNEPWQWPPGTVSGYNAPIGTAIGLTDSLPLLAYLFKPLAPWLPADFQYLGAWELLCFALQGAFGARLIARRSADPVIQLLGATLFVLMPVMLARIAHAALCAHWLILWCLLIGSREPARRCRPVEWAGVGLLAGMIQPYLAAMVLGLLGAVALGRGGPPLRLRAVALGAGSITTLIGWWLSGMFNLGGTEPLTAGGLGFFSMNLLAPISPYGWSTLLPDWPNMGEGQVLEGFHYFGAGILLVMAVAAVLAVVARLRGVAAGARPLWPAAVWAASVAMMLLAISPRVTLGDQVVVDLIGPWAAPLALFRSSGRFMWPLSYLLLTAAVTGVARYGPGRAARGVLAAAVLVQAVDLHDIHLARRRTAHDPAFHEWVNPFVSNRWPVIARHYRHLVVAPPPQCAAAALSRENALQFAAANGLTVNTGTLSRHSEIARARYCQRLQADLAAGRLAGDALYVMLPDGAAAVQAAPGANICGTIDGVTICTAPASAPVWQRYAAPPD